MRSKMKSRVNLRCLLRSSSDAELELALESELDDVLRVRTDAFVFQEGDVNLRKSTRSERPDVFQLIIVVVECVSPP